MRETLGRIERKSILCYESTVPPRKATAAHASRAVRSDPVRARLDVDERRRQLVALGTSLFSERTYDDVSIDELARVAGISKGLLYHYFPTKRDFYVATVKEAASQLLARTATSEGMDPEDRLRDGLDAYIDYVSQHGKSYQALIRSGIGADVEVSRIVDETREAFCARLVEGVPANVRGPMLRVALRGWVGFVEAATVEWIDQRPRIGRVALRDMLAKVLLDAVLVAAS
jgi:AcrR family transcriptional regulator